LFQGDQEYYITRINFFAKWCFPHTASCLISV